jgi:hypothetical protein
MKDTLKLSLIVIFIAIIITTIIGCDIQPVEPVEVTPVELNKTAPAPTPFPYLQEFHNIPIEFEVNGQDITVEIQNRHLFNIAHDYFATIVYPSGSVMIYLTNPSAMVFNIPYYGTTDIQDITIMAIFEYTN